MYEKWPISVTQVCHFSFCTFQSELPNGRSFKFLDVKVLVRGSMECNLIPDGTSDVHLTVNPIYFYDGFVMFKLECYIYSTYLTTGYIQRACLSRQKLNLGLVALPQYFSLLQSCISDTILLCILSSVTYLLINMQGLNNGEPGAATCVL